MQENKIYTTAGHGKILLDGDVNVEPESVGNIYTWTFSTSSVNWSVRIAPDYGFMGFMQYMVNGETTYAFTDKFTSRELEKHYDVTLHQTEIRSTDTLVVSNIKVAFIPKPELGVYKRSGSNWVNGFRTTVSSKDVVKLTADNITPIPNTFIGYVQYDAEKANGDHHEIFDKVIGNTESISIYSLDPWSSLGSVGHDENTIDFDGNELDANGDYCGENIATSSPLPPSNIKMTTQIAIPGASEGYLQIDLFGYDSTGGIITIATVFAAYLEEPNNPPYCVTLNSIEYGDDNGAIDILTIGVYVAMDFNIINGNVSVSLTKIDGTPICSTSCTGIPTSDISSIKMILTKSTTQDEYAVPHIAILSEFSISDYVGVSDFSYTINEDGTMFEHGDTYHITYHMAYTSPTLSEYLPPDITYEYRYAFKVGSYTSVLHGVDKTIDLNSFLPNHLLYGSSNELSELVSVFEAMLNGLYEDKNRIAYTPKNIDMEITSNIPDILQGIPFLGEI